MSFTAGISISLNLGNTVSGFQQVTQAINAANQAATQGASGFNNIGNAAKTTGSSVQSAGSGFTAFGGALRNAASSQQGFTSGLGQMGSAASSSQGAIRNMESAVSNSATTTNTANTAQKFYGTTLTANGTAAAATGTKFNALGQVVSTNADAATKTSTSFGSLNNAMGLTSTGAEKTAASTGKFSAALGTSVGFMGTAVGGGVQLFETFESLERAQVKVEQASTKLGTAQIKETALQNQLNQMAANGDTTSAKYVLTQQKLEEQHNKVQVAEERLGLAQNDLNVTYADFAKNIIPEVIQVTTSMIAAWANMRGEIGGLKAGFSGFVDSLTGAGSGIKTFILGLAEGQTGIKGFGTAMKAVLLNPFVLGLTALAVALLAIHENAFGTRDALNTVGKTVGDMNPIIALIVDSIKAFGIAIGLIPGNADEMTAALHKDVADIGSMFEGLKSRLLNVRLSDVIVGILFAFAPGDVRQKIADTYVEPFIQGIASIPARVTAGAGDLAAKIWAGLVSASRPITNAIDWLQTNIVGPITSAVISIGSRIQTGSTDLVAIIWQGLQSASKVITDAVNWLQTYIVAPITSAVLQIPQRLQVGSIDLVKIIWEGLQKGSKVITDAGQWLFTNIVKPISEALNKVGDAFAAGTGDLGQILWKAIIANSKPITDVSQFVNDKIVAPILNALKNAFGPAGKIIADGLAPANKALEGTGKAVGVIKQSFEEFGTTANNQVGIMNNLGGSFKNVSATVQQQGAFMRVASDGMNEAAGSGEVLSNSEKKVVTAQDAGLASLGKLIPKYADYTTVSKAITETKGLEITSSKQLVDVYAAMGTTLGKLNDENNKSDTQIAAHNQLMKETVFVEQLRKQGIDGQVISLQQIQDKNISTTASLEKYKQQLSDDTMQEAMFTEGINEQTAALLNAQSGTAKMQGQLQQLNSDLASGAQQWVSYQNGLAKADLEFANATAKMSESQGELQSLDAHLANGSAQWLAYHQGIVDADIEFDKFITTSIQAGEKQDELNTKMQVLANAFGGLPGFIEPSIANLETFNKAGLAMQGVLQDGGESVTKLGELVQKSFDDMVKAGDAFFQKLVSAFDKGGKEGAKAFTDAWKGLPDSVKSVLDETDREALSSAAEFAAAGKQAGEGFALKLMAGIAEGKPWNQAVADARVAAMTIIQEFADQNPAMASAAKALFDQLGSASAQQIPIILANAQKIPGPMGEVAAQIAAAMKEKGFDPTVANATQMATDTKTQITSIPQAAQTFMSIGELWATILNAMVSAATIISGQISTAFQGIVTGTVQVFTALGEQWATILNAMVAAVGPTTSSIASAFTQLQSQVAPVFGSLGTLAQQVFNGIVASANSIIPKAAAAFTTLANQAKTGFTQLQAAATASFNAIVSSATSIIPKAATAFTTMATQTRTAFTQIQSSATTAFNAVASAGQSAGQRVSAAMQQIANSAKTATQAVNQLASAINSLKDKTVTITTVHRDVYQSFQHGGVIGGGNTAIGTGGAFIANRQQRHRGHIIGEAGKPELVLPLTKNTSDLADKTINLNAVLNKFKKGGNKGKGDKESDDSKATKIAFITPPPAAPRSSQGGESRPLTVKGKFTNDIPITVNIDGKRFMSLVQRQLLEFSDAQT